jgi:hypothetical protein
VCRSKSASRSRSGSPTKSRSRSGSRSVCTHNCEFSFNVSFVYLSKRKILSQFFSEVVAHASYLIVPGSKLGTRNWVSVSFYVFLKLGQMLGD